MNLEKIKYVYLIGIGGIGMSGLAKYFNSKGKKVSGYDKSPSGITEEMENEGIKIHFDDSIELINPVIKNRANSGECLIIYTPAIHDDNSELRFFKENNYPIHKRAEVLGWIISNYFTIAIAGTHGKTTTTTLLSHIVKTSGISCLAFLGGVSKNYNTNVLLVKGVSKMPVTAVVEADEYDRSFLQFFPDIAIITSIDPDHLDIYENSFNVSKSYSDFANQIRPNGYLITKKHLNEVLKFKGNIFTYSFNIIADYYAKEIIQEEGKYVYTVVTPKGDIKAIRLGVPGIHNIENSVAATAVAQLMNIENIVIREALNTFEGVRRRFDFQIQSSALIFIDDYAHHPQEIRACINSIREMYPDKKITLVFQPHLYSRTRDFAGEFAASLELADELILLDIYPARELPIEGIDSGMLLKKVKLENKTLLNKEELIDYVVSIHPEILVTMGAGDIDLLVKPLKEALIKTLPVNG